MDTNIPWCLVKMETKRPDASRNGEGRPREPNPCLDVALLRISHHSPVTGITAIRETVLYVHPVPGKATFFYLCYMPGPLGRPMISPFADRYDAAAFITGHAGRKLRGITEAERRRVREYFPDVFGRGDGDG
ncbi:MAG: hypothetical protein ABSB80_02825 [Methanoregula sp.]|jgi:hypothetical protein|uniref:hypothetical protein n=1 Tax=Methanoregula sp. TaxID=2052170 RepID=UPI003D1098E4